MGKSHMHMHCAKSILFGRLLLMDFLNHSLEYSLWDCLGGQAQSFWRIWSAELPLLQWCGWHRPIFPSSILSIKRVLCNFVHPQFPAVHLWWRQHTTPLQPLFEWTGTQSPLSTRTAMFLAIPSYTIDTVRMLLVITPLYHPTDIQCSSTVCDPSQSTVWGCQLTPRRELVKLGRASSCSLMNPVG